MNKRISKLLMLAFGICIGTLPPPVWPEDIDLFTGAPPTTATNPNILFVLDNTSNWSGNDQHFEGGTIPQGVAELQAIKTALTGLGAGRSTVNVGIMEFPAAEQGSSPHGGYIRSAIRQMTPANFATFSALLDNMIANYQNSQTDRQNSNLPYGNLMADAYNYFKGLPPVADSSTVANTGNADSDGYTTNYTRFKAPPTGSGCGHNYIIFIANPNSNGPNNDSAANSALLASLGNGVITTQSPHNLFASGNVITNLGFASGCYANTGAGASSCTATEPTGAYSTQCANYASCACDSTTSTAALSTCGTGTQRYSVFGNTATSYTPAPPASVSCPNSSTSGGSTTSWASCSASAAGATATGCGTNQHKFEIFGTKSVTNGDTGTQTSCTNDTATPSTTYTPNAPTGSQTCPANTSPTVSSGSGSVSGTYTLWNSCTSSSTVASSCGTTPPSDKFKIIGTKTAGSASNTGTLSTCSSSGAYGTAATCPAGFVTGTCVYANSKSSCGGGKSQYQIWGLKTATATVTNGATTATVTACSAETSNITTIYTPSPPGSATCPSASGNVSWASCAPSSTSATTTGCGTNQHKFEIYGTQTTTNADTSTQSSCTNDTGNGTIQTTLGNTFACSASGCSTSDYSSVAGSYSGGLTCGSPTTTTGSCPLNGVRYRVQGTNLGVTPTNTLGLFANKYLPLNANLWTQYMNQNGIASTFAVDVYNAKPSNVESELYYSMSKKLGGGDYFAATNAAAIADALTKILNQIQSVNSTFASAALPVNATNRAQNENQVFIGMFRPDPQAKPRWYGNLKRYQLISVPTGIELGDALGVSAVNLQTGFINDCAVSFWSNDSGAYWLNVPSDSFAKGKCSPNSFSPWSDVPDGPLVEKGATAQIQRQGNNPAATPTYVIDTNRKVKTLSGSSLVDFNSTNAPSLPAAVVNFIQGKDVTGENTTSTGGAASTNTRPSIHGDVIHSRPLPLNYGTANGVVAYYGSNDGTLRAVNAADGKELWAFVAPEFFPRLSRLMNNSPTVQFPSSTDTTATAKDYFFDGSIGVYQNTDNSKVWIYPTMHRGGRMIYGFDVTTPSSPTFKWKVGCPDLTDDTGCTTGLTGMGQTWSFPNVAFINGFSTTTPVIIMGGGYDRCEDANSGVPSCSSPKGNAVYVLNADTGAVLATFPTTRSVSADVSLVDINSDGSVDYAYAADTGGNIYRISFVNSPVTLVSQAASLWSMTRVAYTTGANRKFLFGPAVVPAKGGHVYLALGSGDREHPLISHYPYPGALAAGDPGVVNRFYVYVDDLSGTTAINLDDTTLMANATNAGCDPTTMIYPISSKKGWFLDLNKYGPGEQTVTSSVIAAGLVTFSTNRPTVPTASSCSNLGEARGYLVDLFNGSGAIGVPGACGGQISNTFVGGGLPPSPVLATVPISGVTHTVFIGAVQKDGSTSTIIQSQEIDPTISSKRKQVYWKKSGDN